MRNTKVVNLKDGATLIYRKRKMRCTCVTPAFFFGKNMDKYPEPTAHFCEHMLFNGTKNLSKEEMGKQSMEILPTLNASTSSSYIRFHIFRSNKLLKEGLLLASDVMLNPTMPEEYFQGEKGVIKQELVKNSGNVGKNFRDAFFKTIRNHYIDENQVSGSPKEIDDMDLNTIKDFYNEIAIRQNFVCAVVSQLPLYKIKKHINEYFIENMASNPSYSVDRTTPDMFNFEKPGNMTVVYFPVPKTTVKIAINLGNCTEKEELVANFFASLLSRPFVGDLFNKLRGSGLAYTSQAANFFTKNVHYFSFNFTCTPENVNQIIDIIGEILKTRRNELYNENYLLAIKKNQEYLQDEASTNKKELGKDLLDEYIFMGTKYFKSKDKHRRKKIVENINNEDIREFVKSRFNKPENVYVTIQTEKEYPDFYSYEKIQKIITGNE